MEKDIDFLFNWDNVRDNLPGKDRDRLLWFLKYALDIYWAEDADIKKIDENTIQISRGDKSVDIVIDKNMDKVIVKSIKPYELILKDKNNIYKKAKINKDFLFNWESFSEKDKDRLMWFLKYALDIDWVEDAKVNKTDEYTIHICKEGKAIDVILDKKNEKATIRTHDGRIHGLIVKYENNRFNIYRKPKEIWKHEVKDHLVGTNGTIFIFFLLIFYSILLLIIFIQSWPPPTSASTPQNLTSPNLETNISIEIRLLIIVALSGALGGLVHALRSFYKYVGTRTLMWSWLPMYFLLPFIGASLGIISYLVIRGGFSPQVDVTQISAFGFAGFAALAGLFSDPTMRKLKRVAETLLAESEKGENHYGKLDKEIETKSDKGEI